MTDTTIYERISVLETQREEDRRMLEGMNSKLDDLVAFFNQAKGVRRFIVAAAAVVVGLVAFGSGLAAWRTFIKG